MELRAVVYGGKFSGKTLMINAVFSKDLLQNQKRTAHCKKHQGNACGRDLALVDTPGWWKHFPLSDTPTFLKQELIQGVSLCHPGPHAVILAIEIDIPFTEKHRKAAEDHLELLGEQIWKYALVVFTRSHSLRYTTIEEHIAKEGEALQWLLEKCGNRHHVFDSDKSQLELLLEKIENILQSNNGGYFQIEAKPLEDAAKWKNMVMTKAKSRESKLQEQKTNLSQEKLRIALLGWVIAGKSSAGNTILNQKVFVTGQSTVECKTEHGEVDGRPITVLDTPSWFKYFPSQYTPEWINLEILNSLKLTSQHCVLLVIPGDTSFREEQRKVIEENMSFLGEQVWRHTIVLFTWGDILGDLSIEQHIESEGEALQWVIDKCENRYHVFNNEERENRVQVTKLLQKIDGMVRNSYFRPSTEMFVRIPTQREVDAQSEASGVDSDLPEIVRYVDEEWRRRDKKLIERVSKVEKDIKATLPKGAGSLDTPPYMGETTSNIAPENNTEKQGSETDPEPCNLDEEKRPLKIKNHIKDMLDREWSRREEALMGRVLEMLSELRCDAQSEPTENDKERSREKVLDWFEGQGSLGYSSASSSIKLDTVQSET